MINQLICIIILRIDRAEVIPLFYYFSGYRHHLIPVLV
jgi:hypothetical protein